MISIVGTPLRTLTFGLAGAALALFWYKFHPALPTIIVAVVFIAGMFVQKIGEDALPDDPVRAVRWLEWRELSISIMTAALAALAIVVAVEVVSAGKAEGDAPDVAAQKEALKEIVSAVSAALVAFLAAISVKPEDVDKAVGNHIRSQFHASYGMIGQQDDGAKPGQRKRRRILLPQGSRGLDAVYSEYAWPDWSRESRRKRAEELALELETLELQTRTPR